MSQVELSIENQVAKVTLNRPEMHNAFNEHVISSLIECFDKVENDNSIRVMVLQASGHSFSAGADLNWMQKMASYSESQNLSDARQLSLMFSKLYNLSTPTIAKIQGSAFGGAIGLVACCDIAIASRMSKFCLSEVKLGLIPAVISPYVIKAIGERAARRYFLTAEVFDAHTAKQLGLVHQITGNLDCALDNLLQTLIDNGPVAVKAAKALINDVANKEIDNEIIALTAERIAKIRVSDEGQEGLTAFFEKRPPQWQL